MEKLDEIIEEARKVFPSGMKCRPAGLTHFLGHSVRWTHNRMVASVLDAFVYKSTDDFCTIF